MTKPHLKTEPVKSLYKQTPDWFIMHPFTDKRGNRHVFEPPGWCHDNPKLLWHQTDWADDRPDCFSKWHIHSLLNHWVSKEQLHSLKSCTDCKKKLPIVRVYAQPSCRLSFTAEPWGKQPGCWAVLTPVLNTVYTLPISHSIIRLTATFLLPPVWLPLQTPVRHKPIQLT